MATLLDLLEKAKQEAEKKVAQLQQSLVSNAKAKAAAEAKKTAKVIDVAPKAITPVAKPKPVDKNSVLYIGPKDETKPKVSPLFVPNTQLVKPTDAQAQKMMFDDLFDKGDNAWKEDRSGVKKVADLVRKTTSDFGVAANKKINEGGTLDQRIANAKTDEERRKIILANVGLGESAKRLAAWAVPAAGNVGANVVEPFAQGAANIFNEPVKTAQDTYDYLRTEIPKRANQTVQNLNDFTAREKARRDSLPKNQGLFKASVNAAKNIPAGLSDFASTIFGTGDMISGGTGSAELAAVTAPLKAAKQAASDVYNAPSIGEGLGKVVTGGLNTAWETGKLVNPFLRGGLVAPEVIGKTVEGNVPESLRGVANAALIANAIRNSPEKFAALGAFGGDQLANQGSKYFTGKTLQENAMDIQNPFLRDLGVLAANSVPGLVGGVAGKAFEKQYGRQLDSAVKALQHTGSPTEAVNAMKKVQAREANPMPVKQISEVRGYQNIPAEVVNMKLPAKTFEQQAKNKPIVERIRTNLNAIDQELGLTNPEAGDFGKAKGFLGNVMGAPAAVRKKLTGSSLPLIQQATGKAREAVAQGASKLMSQNNIAGKTARGLKSVVGGLGKTEKSVDDLGKVKGLMADFSERADFISKKVYADLTAEAKQDMGGVRKLFGAPKGSVQGSLEKIHALMDPELARPEFKGTKLADLSPAEAKAYSLLTRASDVINDMSYQLGGISKEQWQAKQGGKYITRAYTPIDLPDDGVVSQVKNAFGKKKGVAELDAYKKREDITPWKMDNAIRDPVYLVNKRLVEVGKNMGIQRYFNQVATNPELVSDTKRSGYVQVKGAEFGDSSPTELLKNYVEKVYGITGSAADDAIKQIKINGDADQIIRTQNKIYSGVKGKYVRQDVLDDIQGFSFATDLLQQTYDLAKKTTEKPTRLLKIAKTAMSLPTRLQNKVSNLWYATIGGVNPAEMVAERLKIFGSTVKGKITGANDYKANKVYRFLLQNGVLDNDFSKSDLQGRAKNVALGKNDGFLKKGYDYVVNSYGAEDVKSKVAYASVLAKRGYSAPEILKQVRDNFQDYSRVGKAFDFASKMPVGGLPFSKWKSEGARLFKNSLVNRPVRALTLMLGFQAMKNYMSEQAGETQVQREEREGRANATTMPFSDLISMMPGLGEAVPEYGISTEIKIPNDAADFFGVPHGTVINIGRLWGQSTVNDEPGKRSTLGRLAESLSPVAIPKSQDTAITDFFGSGLLLGPAVQTLGDSNFIGGSIKDPSLSKFREESYLPASEQWGNRAEYLARQYAPPILSDVLDLNRVSQGQQTYYGSKRSPEQQALRMFTGLKTEVQDEAIAKQRSDRALEEERVKRNEELNFRIDNTIRKAASTKSVDMVELTKGIREYTAANSYVSKNELEAAKKMKTYKNKSEQFILSTLEEQKRNESKRRIVKSAIEEMTWTGVKNPGVRDEYEARTAELLRVLKGTYEEEDDYRVAGNKLIKDRRSKWK